jgi:chromosomal replication initiator protein
MDKKNINIKVLEKQLINNLEQTINDKMILNSFIKGLRVVSFDEKKIILFVNSKESKKTIEKYYLDIFQKAIKNILNLSLKIKFVLNSESLLYEEKKINSHINPNLNFDSYVISKFNESVIKISKTIIKKIGKYSPFYISSKSGLGKTHLLHAIGNKLLKKNINTLYIEPNRFTEKITKLSNKKDGISNYINNLKKYDVILFDDIQIMGDKVVTLKVLFQIVNYFVENKKQIIITSDKVAQELSGFEERFITRFESGISEKINKLKIEDVSKILIKKLEEENLNPKK